MVHIAFLCLDCRTVVKMGQFPDTNPYWALHAWIKEQKELLSNDHFCQRDQVPQRVELQTLNPRRVAKAFFSFVAARPMKTDNLPWRG